MSDCLFLAPSKKNTKAISESQKQKEEAEVRKNQEDAAGAMDEKMKEEEQELTMLKDCASMMAQAKIEAENEAKEKKLDTANLEELLSQNVKVKPTGAIKIVTASGEPIGGKSERSKGSMAADRLLEDKMYLSELAKGINIKQRTHTGSKDGADNVYKGIKDAAEEALQFLTDREDFWDQLALGKDKGSKKGSKGRPCKALESTRLIF